MKTFLVLSTCLFVTAVATMVSAQTTQTTNASGNVVTTESSDKYGSGGTHQTVSDKTNYRLIAEFYYDKCGRKRESVYPGSSDGKIPPQTSYFDEEGRLELKVLHSKMMGDVYIDSKGDKMDPAQGKAVIEKLEKTSSPCPEKPGGQVKAKPETPPSLVAPSGTSPFLGQPFSPSTFSWTGPYMGIQFGYTRSSSDYNLKLGGLWNDFPDTRNEIQFQGMREFDENGFGLGGCAGYNYEFNNRFVIGAGVAGRKFWGLDAMHNTGDFSTGNTGDFDVWSKFRTTGIVTFGPKVGHACGRFLPYVSGGLAFGELDTAQKIFSSNFGGFREMGKASENRLGWTLGTGLQYAVTNNWSLRMEYSYSDLGTFKYAGKSSDTFHDFTTWHMATLTEHGGNFGIVYNFSQFGQR